MPNPRRRPLERWQVVELLRGSMEWRDASIAERREAVRILSERGRTAEQIAVELHITERTVTRARTALRVGSMHTPAVPSFELPFLLHRCIPHRLR